MKLSIVIPVYNSELTISKLVHSLLAILKQYHPEIVLINDASSDKSESICTGLANKFSQVKFISLRKNSGEHNAVICGLNFCTGDYVAIIDDDFQNPPTEIIKLLHKIRKYNYDVIYAKYETKQHSLFRNICSRLTNALANYLINKPKGLYLSSFKIISKEIIPSIISYKGPFPYIDALVLRCTNNLGSEIVLHEHRLHGKSNYTLKKLLSLYLNMFINFSYKPLRIVTFSGLIISVGSVLMAAFILYEKLFKDNITPGWTFLSMLLLFSIGMTFIVIGLLGEYIGKILMSLNASPQFTVKKIINTEMYDKTAITADYDR